MKNFTKTKASRKVLAMGLVFEQSVKKVSRMEELAKFERYPIEPNEILSISITSSARNGRVRKRPVYIDDKNSIFISHEINRTDNNVLRTSIFSNDREKNVIQVLHLINSQTCVCSNPLLLHDINLGSSSIPSGYNEMMELYYDFQCIHCGLEINITTQSWGKDSIEKINKLLTTTAYENLKFN